MSSLETGKTPFGIQKQRFPVSLQAPRLQANRRIIQPIPIAPTLVYQPLSLVCLVEFKTRSICKSEQSLCPQIPLSQQLSKALIPATMRGDTLIQQHPPTPPNAGLEYQIRLHQVAQYNVDRGYSFGEAGYGSPGSVAHEGIPSHASHAGNHPRGLGLGIQYVKASAFSHI